MQSLQKVLAYTQTFFWPKINTGIKKHVDFKKIDAGFKNAQKKL
jgi:hypothetical protein